MTTHTRDREPLAALWQHKPHGAGHRPGRTMDQQAMDRMRVVLVDLAAIRVLRRILEWIFDAVDLIAKPMRLIDGLACVRGNHLEVSIVELPQGLDRCAPREQ